MPEIGLLCSQAQQRREIHQTLQMILFHQDLDYSIHIFSPIKGVEAKLQDRVVYPECDRYALFLLSWNIREEAFEIAETLWNKEPALPIIFVAQEAEDVFFALSYPFFHIVRIYALEQDLQAAVRKMERLRPLMPENITFRYGTRILKLSRKDILYLDSDHHDIKIHMEAKNEWTTETLTECEKRLRNRGFIRIHKSYLVNMYHISQLEKDSLLLSNQERLYISRYRYAEVKLQFETFIRRLEFMQ